MKTTVEIGKTYALRSEAGGEVTDVDGKTLDTLEPNKQVHMTAQESEWLVPDDCKVTKTTFNYALAALGLLGGGDKLPVGYTRLEFLGSTGTQYIDTEVYNFESFIIDYKNTGGSYWSNILGHIPSGYTRRFAATSGQYVAVFNPNQGHIRGTLDHSPYVRNVVEHSIAMGAKLILNGEFITYLDYIDINPVFDTIEGDLSAYLFASNLGSSVSYGYAEIYGCTMFDNTGVKIRDFIPTLDKSGEPCMFDRVSKTAFKNSGTGRFIAGMTLAQAAQLGRKLPSTGGKLTVSLPKGYGMNERVVNSLAEAESKGWVLTIQTYAAQTAAATFALRRVWVRRQQDENGGYVAADGSRWLVEWCVDVIGADPEGLGYERFRSVEAAVAYWELEPYEYPEENAD